MSSRNSGGWFLLAVLFCVPTVFWVGTRIVKGVVFDINCEGHLKRAADANTVEMAAQELDLALKYLEQNNMTSGYTAVLWNSPDTDVGFFYNNLKSSRDELNKVTSETTQLERTNVLMKLRETLLDHGDHGDHVTLPDGISVFPHTVFWFWSGWFVVFLLVIGIIFGIIAFAKL